MIRRVKAAAQKLGYRRDAHLTELMTHLRRRREVNDRPLIAFLFRQHFPINRDIFQQKDSLFGGMWHRAWDNGYQPEIFNIGDYGPHPQRLGQILWTRGIRGVILCPAEHPSPLPSIQWERFSVVAIGFSIRSDRLHRCVANMYQGMLSSIANLQALGYRRLGAVISSAIDERTQRSARAAYLVIREAEKGRHFVPALTVAPGHEAAVAAWWTKWKPEAIVCGGSIQIVLSAFARLGITVPADVGLADLQVLESDHFSGIDQNSFEVGVTAIDLLVTLLQNNQIGLPTIPRTILVNGRWVDGSSTRLIVSEKT